MQYLLVILVPQDVIYTELSFQSTWFIHVEPWSASSGWSDINNYCGLGDIDNYCDLAVYLKGLKAR